MQKYRCWCIGAPYLICNMLLLDRWCLPQLLGVPGEAEDFRRKLSCLDMQESLRNVDMPGELAYWLIGHTSYWPMGSTAAGIWAVFRKGVVDYHPISDTESSPLNSSMQTLYCTSLKIFIKYYLNWQLGSIKWEKEPFYESIILLPVLLQSVCEVFSV